LTLIQYYLYQCSKILWAQEFFSSYVKTSHKEKISFFLIQNLISINLINEKFQEVPTKRLKPLYFAILSYFKIRWEIVCWFLIKHIFFFKTAFFFYNSTFRILCMFFISILTIIGILYLLFYLLFTQNKYMFGE